MYTAHQMLLQQIFVETDSEVVTSGPFETLDVTDGQKLHDIAKRNEVDTIIHFSSFTFSNSRKKSVICMEFKYGWTCKCSRSSS